MAIVRHRVVPLLAPHAAALGLPDVQQHRLHEMHLGVAGAGLANAAHTDAASAVLADAGVDHLVVKGAVLPPLVGQTPASRGPGDIDVWVRTDAWADAERALGAAGWSRRDGTADLPVPGDGWRGRVVQRVGMEMPLDHPRRSTVDLHWRLVPDHREVRFGFDEALARSVPVPEVGPTVRTLCPVDALDHIAQHGRKEHWPVLRQLVDVADLAAACGDDLEELVRTSPNARVALATAAHVDARLSDLPGIDRRARRLADEAWTGCLSLHWPLSTLWSATGLERVRVRARRESWDLRSAPSASVAAAHVGRALVPVRLLTDPHPLRHRRHRTKG
jgi:hypothetical protein